MQLTCENGEQWSLLTPADCVSRIPLRRVGVFRRCVKEGASCRWRSTLRRNPQWTLGGCVAGHAFLGSRLHLSTEVLMFLFLLRGCGLDAGRARCGPHSRLATTAAALALGQHTVFKAGDTGVMVKMGPVYGLLMNGVNRQFSTYDPVNNVSKLNPYLSIGIATEQRHPTPRAASS